MRALLNKLLVPYRALNHRLDTLNRTTADLHRNLTLQSPRYADPRHLAHFGYKVYSAGDEDGVIAEIFRRVGTTNRYFVEFGVADGMENDTLALLQDGWRGAWLEADDAFVAAIRGTFAPLLEKRRIVLKHGFVYPDNIEALFDELQVPAEFDFLSIDIDSNDYWVWDAIRRFSPRVVAIEYNASLGPSLNAKQRYTRERIWEVSTRAHGAGLKALELLGRAKGYSLVGCSYQGTNAFFVRDDLVADRFQGPFNAETFYEPPRYYLRFYGGHPLSRDEIDAFFWEEGDEGRG